MASAALLEILETEDFFLRLGLPPRQKAAPADVRKSYRKRALLCHPDKVDHPRANEAFQALSEAFECLHDEASQAIYIQQLAAHASGKRKRPSHGGGGGKKRGGGGGGRQRPARSWADIERDLARKEEAERRLRAQFVTSQSSRFNEQAGQRLLERAQKICRTLDERSGRTELNPLWAAQLQAEMPRRPEDEVKLPPGWECRVDAASSRLYYFMRDPNTGAAQAAMRWEHPNAEVAAERARIAELVAAAEGGEGGGAAGGGGGGAREKLQRMLEYLHTTHDYHDLDDEVTELDEETAAAGSGAAAASGGGGLAADEYDY